MDKLSKLIVRLSEQDTWIPKDVLNRPLKIGDTVAQLVGGGGYSKLSVDLAEVIGFDTEGHKVQIEKYGFKSKVKPEKLILTFKEGER